MTIAKVPCDRCHKMRPYDYLVSDGVSPGLRVCPRCRDLPLSTGFGVKPDNFTLQYPRIEEELETDLTPPPNVLY